MKRLSILFSIILLLWGGTALASSLDLSGFLGDPLGDVTINVSAGTIDLDESDWGTNAYDDPFLVADDALELTFDYNLVLGTGDVDWLVVIVDTDDPRYIDGSDYLFETNVAVTGGEATIDMSAFRGEEVYLSFGLESDWYDDNASTSSAHLYNIELTTAPIPEPATLFLLGAGLIAAAGVGRKKQ